MEHASSLILVDSDTRRRASICHLLALSQVYVEPFEDVSELAGSWPRSGVVLIHDIPGAIAGLIALMAQHGDWLPVTAFSENPTAAQIVEATLEGAIDFLSWPFDEEDISAMLVQARERARNFGNARLCEAAARSRIQRLTNRERQVLSGVAGGLSNRLIGEKLSISPRTVEIHRANMLNKLGASHSSDAIRIAIEANLPS